MKNLLESLKKGGKRSEAEAEFQFMLYFYNLIPIFYQFNPNNTTSIFNQTIFYLLQ